MRLRLIILSIITILIVSCATRYSWWHPHNPSEYEYNVVTANCDMYAQGEKMNAAYVSQRSPFAGLIMIAAYDRAFESCMQSKGWQKVSSDFIPPTKQEVQKEITQQNIAQQRIERFKLSEARAKTKYKDYDEISKLAEPLLLSNNPEFRQDIFDEFYNSNDPAEFIYKMGLDIKDSKRR